MAKMFRIVDDMDERGYEGDDKLLEKAFHEGCEHGYKKAMRELEGYNERGGHVNYRGHHEGFEEKIAKLKEKYK